MDNQKTLKRGFLFVFEGIDGVGKTTQAKILSKTLKNHFNCDRQIYYFHQPTYLSPSSKKLKEILKQNDSKFFNDIKKVKEVYSLFLEDREYHVKNEINPKLKEGAILILDRYYFSSFAYQYKIPFETINKDHQDFPKADLIFVIDLDLKSVMKRINERNHEKTLDLFEKENYLNLVRNKFLSLKTYFVNENIFIIDGNKKEKILSNIIFNKVKDVLYDY